MVSAIEQLASNMSYASFSKAEDLKKRILFTLLVLIVYRIGTYIPVPGINPDVMADYIRQNAGGILGVFDMFSGGALSRMTVFTLNIMPYITTSIVMQLMTSVSPHLEALKKEGESGRKKITQYTRYGTVLLAAVQAYGIAFGLEKMVGHTGLSAVVTPGFFFRITTMVTLVGGTMFIMWLGEQISSRGIGNGISLIIFSGIVANLPQAIFNTLELGRSQVLSALIILAIMIAVPLVIFFIVFMEKAQRRILIQYPKRQVAEGRPATAQTTHLPLKLNSSGVIGPIFAQSIILFPASIAAFVNVDADSWAGMITRQLQHGTPVYMMMYGFFIIFFTFLYTAMVFNPAETAENLRKMGTYIPGIRPGKNTADYLDYVLMRLTAVGSLYLAAVCLLPEFIHARVTLPFYLGGTSLLIVVSVTIDTIAQVQSHLLAHQYEGLIKSNKSKRGRIK